ncbi:MAG: cytochrome c [Polyangiales bacterium]
MVIIARRWVAALGLGLCCAVGCGDEEPPPRSPITEPSDPRCAIAPVSGSVAPGTVAVTGAALSVAAPTQTIISGPVIQPEKSPPAISGGTLLVTRDRSLLVAADPDRDQVYFVDPTTQRLLFTRELTAGDEPGRLVEDASGQVHVVLRGSGGVATLGRRDADPILRRHVCDLPRGIAYDATANALHVACAEGDLVTLPIAADATQPRRLHVGGDLRDVVVRETQLYVSRFRSAELVAITREGVVQPPQAAPSITRKETLEPQCSAPNAFAGTQEVRSTPTVAWRMLDVPGRGITMLHQRAREAEVSIITPRGYGSGGFNSERCAPGIVASAISTQLEGSSPASADLGDLTLAVDIATDAQGTQIAVAAPGNASSSAPQVEIFSTVEVEHWTRPLGDPPSTPPFVPNCHRVKIPARVADGQATAVAFVSPDVLAIQSREPAAITLVDTAAGKTLSQVNLQQPSRFDTGHALFHARASSGLACASCHPEGGDDSHVWTFETIGSRRTQQLRGGILGTEPFHWDGDMIDFAALVDEVFVGRMGANRPTPEQTAALATYIDRLPTLKLTAADSNAVERGKQLFEAEAVGCATCHAGSAFTNNEWFNVGTGAYLQVPSLHNVALRTPLMHDGCASTLMDRFTLPCGGGEAHGHTAQLSAPQLADLVAYVATL